MLAGAWSRGAPTTLVFDRRHVLVKRIEGTASLAQLNAALKQCRVYSTVTVFARLRG